MLTPADAVGTQLITLVPIDARGSALRIPTFALRGRKRPVRMVVRRPKQAVQARNAGGGAPVGGLELGAEEDARVSSLDLTGSVSLQAWRKPSVVLNPSPVVRIGALRRGYR